jgi:hypothetical protein
MVPGFYIAIVTFPGVIVHEFAHKLFCQITGTKVIKVCYLRFGNPSGYVQHEPATNVWKYILIGVGPFVVNTTIGFGIGMIALMKCFHAGALGYVGMFLIWLGVSVAMHSFPSTGDAKYIWSAVWEKGAPISTRLVATPLVVIVLLGALGSVFWLDLLYGMGIAMGLPKLLFG